MCNRLNQHLTHLQRREVLRTGVLPEWASRFNVGFSTRALMLRRDGPHRLVSEAARWGLVPNWSKGPDDPRCKDLWHARAESLHEKPSFREALASRRCVIPAAGFYEAEDIGRGERQNWYIRPADDGLLLIAGLYDVWSHGSETLVSLAVVTSAPNETVARIHDRMPVVLDEPAALSWLDHGGQQILRPCPADLLTIYPVSHYVAKRGSEGPQCIEPIRPQKFLFE